MSTNKEFREVQIKINRMRQSSFRLIEVDHYYYGNDDDVTLEDVVVPMGKAHRPVENHWDLYPACNRNRRINAYVLPRSVVSKAWAPDCTRSGCFPKGKK